MNRFSLEIKRKTREETMIAKKHLPEHRQVLFCAENLMERGRYGSLFVSVRQALMSVSGISSKYALMCISVRCSEMRILT
jgi:Holliday junction resolvasome RuvABC DNA-binding subunit